MKKIFLTLLSVGAFALVGCKDAKCGCAEGCGCGGDCGCDDGGECACGCAVTE